MESRCWYVHYRGGPTGKGRKGKGKGKGKTKKEKAQAKAEKEEEEQTKANAKASPGTPAKSDAVKAKEREDVDKSNRLKQKQDNENDYKRRDAEKLREEEKTAKANAANVAAGATEEHPKGKGGARGKGKGKTLEERVFDPALTADKPCFYFNTNVNGGWNCNRKVCSFNHITTFKGKGGQKQFDDEARVPAQVAELRNNKLGPKDAFIDQGGTKHDPAPKGGGKGKEAGTFVCLDTRNVCMQRSCKSQACLDTNDHPNAKDSDFVDSSANDAVNCQPCGVVTKNSWSPFSSQDD